VAKATPEKPGAGQEFEGLSMEELRAASDGASEVCLVAFLLFLPTMVKHPLMSTTHHGQIPSAEHHSSSATTA